MIVRLYEWATHQPEALAVWMCPRCGRVLTQDFSTPQSYSLNTLCSHGPYEPVFKMTPVTDAAKSVEKWHQEQIDHMRQSAERARAELENWPPIATPKGYI